MTPKPPKSRHKGSMAKSPTKVRIKRAKPVTPVRNGYILKRARR